MCMIFGIFIRGVAIIVFMVASTRERARLFSIDLIVPFSRSFIIILNYTLLGLQVVYYSPYYC